MKTNIEIYIWIAVIVAILTAALYFRYLYQPELGIELSINTSVHEPMYPYQTLLLPIKVYNSGGTAIRNMSIGVEINGTLTRLYKVTLPAGKETVINYNFTSAVSGKFNISAAADPGMLYNIINRQKTRAGINFSVETPEVAVPYRLLPYGNITALGTYNLNGAGLITSSFLYGGYNISEFRLTSINGANRLLYPILDTLVYYIRNLSVAYANYSDGSTAYSIWLKGYVSPNMTNTAAKIYGVNSVNLQMEARNVTSVSLGNKTSVCSFYSNGWIKILAFEGNSNCLDKLNSTGLTNFEESMFYSRTVPNSLKIFGNFTDFAGTVSHAATLYMMNGTALNRTSIIYASITRNSSMGSICASHRNYGIVGKVDNVSYCNTYIPPVSPIGNNGISLLETKAYIGRYNLSVLSVTNTSGLSEQVPINIGIIRNFNITGTSFQFISGLRNSCTFNASLGCGNVTFSNSTLHFKLTNNVGEKIELNSVSCYKYPPVFNIELNSTILVGQSDNVTVACYNLGKSISGLTIGLNLNLLLNYTRGNRSYSTLGSAFLTLG